MNAPGQYPLPTLSHFPLAPPAMPFDSTNRPATEPLGPNASPAATGLVSRALNRLIFNPWGFFSRTREHVLREKNSRALRALIASHASISRDSAAPNGSAQRLFSEQLGVLANASNPNSADLDGVTALMLAARADLHAVIPALIPHSDPLACEREGGLTALMIAVDGDPSEPERCVDSVKALLPHSDPLQQNVLGDTAFLMAARLGFAQKMMVLAPVSQPKAARDKWGNTALHLLLSRPFKAAIFNSFFSLSDSLLSALPLCDARQANDKGETPLMMAMWLDDGSHADAIKALAAASDLEARDAEGNTTLLIAARLNAVQHARLILDKGADLQAVNADGLTAAAIALQRRNFECAEMLLRRAAAPAANSDAMRVFQNAFFQAIAIGRWSAAELLAPMIGKEQADKGLALLEDRAEELLPHWFAQSRAIDDAKELSATLSMARPAPLASAGHSEAHGASGDPAPVSAVHAPSKARRI